MKITFTNHSNQRISERGILKSEIKEAVRNPTSVLPSYNQTEKIQKVFGNKTLEVILEKEGQFIKIITAYYL